MEAGDYFMDFAESTFPEKPDMFDFWPLAVPRRYLGAGRGHNG